MRNDDLSMLLYIVLASKMALVATLVDSYVSILTAYQDLVRTRGDGCVLSSQSHCRLVLLNQDSLLLDEHWALLE
jgi:hypothetical protein